MSDISNLEGYSDFYPNVGYLREGKIVQETSKIDAFHIGQSYERKPATPIECVKCHGTEFHVGRGEYYTALRCPVCKWEFCIHEG